MLRYFAKRVVRLLVSISSGKSVKIDASANVNFKTRFEGKNKIYPDVSLEGSYLGIGSYISSRSVLRNCKIGRYCSIANDVAIISGKHPTTKFVTTHPAFFSSRQQAGFSYVKSNSYEELELLENGYDVDIGNDVWIGAHVKIKQGVKIGDGAIVGSMSLVLKDVEPYSIVVGVPARHIKYRFTSEEVKQLLKLKWWELEESVLVNQVKLFENIDLYLSCMTTGE